MRLATLPKLQPMFIHRTIRATPNRRLATNHKASGVTVSIKKHTKCAKKFYNATQAAEYLGVSRQFFYVLKRKYQLEPAQRDQAIPLFAALDLMRIKALRDGR